MEEVKSTFLDHKLQVDTDATTLEQTLRIHGDALFDYVHRQMPPNLRRVNDPEDIVQDVFFEAILRVKDFVAIEPDSVRAWLFTIARHRVIGVIRKHRTAKRGGGRIVGEGDVIEHHDVILMLQDLAIYERTPSQSALSHEMLLTLETAMATLCAEQLQCLRLRYIQGFTVPETAAAMQKSEAAVRMLCVRALQTLRVQMRSASSSCSGISP